MQVTDQQAREAIRQFRASAPPLTSGAVPATRFAEIEADRDRDLEQRIRRWEKNKPMRERAAAAMQRAQERLIAELGEGHPGPVPVFAAAWSEKPAKSPVW